MTLAAVCRGPQHCRAWIEWELCQLQKNPKARVVGPTNQGWASMQTA